MGHSLKQRFNGNSAEVIQYAREHGILKAMEQYQVKDYERMDNFLHELAPGEKFQVSKGTGNPATDPDYFDRIIEAVFRKFEKMSQRLADQETIISKQANMINELQAKLDIKKQADWRNKRSQIEHMMQLCEQ